MLNNTYTFKENLTDYDKFKATLFLTLNVVPLKRGLIWAIAPFIIIVFLSGIVGKWDNQNGLVLIYPAILLLLIFGGTFVGVKLLPKQKNVELLISKVGITRKGDGFCYSRTWNDFSYWDESKSYIFVYFKNSKVNAHIIKKSNFSSKTELTDFLYFIDDCLKKE